MPDMNDVLLILIIVLVALVIVRGPKMLPRIGEAMGRTVKETRKEFDGVMSKDGERPSDPPSA